MQKASKLTKLARKFDYLSHFELLQSYLRGVPWDLRQHLHQNNFTLTNCFLFCILLSQIEQFSSRTIKQTHNSIWLVYPNSFCLQCDISFTVTNTYSSVRKSRLPVYHTASLCLCGWARFWYSVILYSQRGGARQKLAFEVGLHIIVKS